MRSFYLQREHPALQDMKIRYFFIFVGHFCPQSTQINADPFGARFGSTRIRMRIRIHNPGYNNSFSSSFILLDKGELAIPLQM